MFADFVLRRLKRDVFRDVVNEDASDDGGKPKRINQNTFELLDAGHYMLTSSWTGLVMLNLS